MHAWSDNWWQRNQPNSHIIVPFLSQNINTTQNKPPWCNNFLFCNKCFLAWLHNKRAMVRKGLGYPSNWPHRGVPFSELAHWVLKGKIKFIANQWTNPEVSYSMVAPYTAVVSILSSEWVKKCVLHAIVLHMYISIFMMEVLAVIITLMQCNNCLTAWYLCKNYVFTS